MTTWYLAKISFQHEMDNGTLATVKEAYLIDAVSYTEAEAKVYEIVANNTPEFTIDSISKKKLSDVFDGNGEETFYEAKIEYTIVSDNGKEKVHADSILISESSIQLALELLAKELSTMLIPFEVTSIVKTSIIEVVRHVGERPYIDKSGRGSILENIEATNINTVLQFEDVF